MQVGYVLYKKYTYTDVSNRHFENIMEKTFRMFSSSIKISV